MKDKLERVREWWLKAQSDMQIASHEMQWEEPATDAVCFHFQQAVEKMLKAWLIWQDVDFPPTHNIEVLLALCEPIDQTFVQLRTVEALTPYSVDVRYADSFYFPTMEEAAEAADMARTAESFILGRFARAGVDMQTDRN
jgi:HEPN domain-containing protein